MKNICNLQKNIMVKKVFGMLVAFGMILMIGLSIHTTSYAYTEEEKAQAKAWLSAHGYSPDAAGASQAYQDYLDGKFDEELGITTESAQSSETTTEGESSEQDTETTADENKKTENGESEDSGKSGSDDTNSVSSGTTEENVSTEDTEVSSEKEEESPQQDDVKEQEKIELYHEASTGQYREAFLVILLGVGCMLLVVLFFGRR